MKLSSKYSLWYLFTTLMYCQSFTLILLNKGCPKIFFLMMIIFSIMQLVSLIYYLNNNTNPTNKIFKTILKVNFLVSFIAIFALILSIWSFLSQYHHKIHIDGKGSIAELNMNDVEKSKNSYVYKVDNLLIIFPKYNTINFAVGKRPDDNDKNITFVGAAAYEHDYALSFHHKNIEGDYSSYGKYYKGHYLKGLNAFTYYNNKGHFVRNNPDDEIKNAANNGGDGFEQFLLINNYEKVPFVSNEYRCFRVLSEINNKLCIIECEKQMEFSKFYNSLLELNLKDAMVLDMGAGWNYSWYRDNQGMKKVLFSIPFIFSQNWIVFTK